MTPELSAYLRAAERSTDPRIAATAQGLRGLVEKGLAEVEIVDGRLCPRLTELGLRVFAPRDGKGN